MTITEKQLHQLCDDEYAMSRLVVEQIAISPADYDALFEQCVRDGRFPRQEQDVELVFVTSHGRVEVVKADWVKTPVVTVCAVPKR